MIPNYSFNTVRFDTSEADWLRLEEQEQPMANLLSIYFDAVDMLMGKKGILREIRVSSNPDVKSAVPNYEKQVEELAEVTFQLENICRYLNPEFFAD